MDSLSLYLTKSGYAMPVVAGLLFLGVFGYRLWHDNNMSKDGRAMGMVVWMIVLILVVRVGYFSLSRAFPTEGFMVGGSPHNEFLWGLKWLMAQITGWTAMIVFMRAVHLIKPLDFYEATLMVVGVTIGVIILTVLG